MFTYLYTVPGEMDLLSLEIPLILFFGGLCSALLVLFWEYFNNITPDEMGKSPAHFFAATIILMILGGICFISAYNNRITYKSNITVQSQIHDFCTVQDKKRHLRVTAPNLWDTFYISDPVWVAAFDEKKENIQVFLVWDQIYSNDDITYRVEFANLKK
jgi:hypothetical protein